MKNKFFALLITMALILTLLPATALAANTLEVGAGMYDLTEVGLNAAIADASDGDTIKFTASGTIPLTNDIVIDKSITLDMNGQTVGLNSPSTFDFLSIPNGYSVTVKGPGTITTNTYIYVNNTATLTVQGDAVVEGTGVWQTLMNYGTVSMMGGALRQTNGNFVFQNSGAATFDNVTIETSHGDGSVIWAADGTLTLNNCTTRNNFWGTMTGTLPSVILVSGSGAVTLNGGFVTGPAGATLPAIEAASTTTLTNNGATITNGYVKKLGDLSVSVSSGVAKVTLASQTAEPGVTYYYKMTAADDTAAKPASYESAAFASTGWTPYSAATDISAAGTAAVYVQVVKVGDSEQKIYGWGQGSATPAAVPLTGVSISNISPQVGDTLTANVTPSDAAVSYQWQADGVNAASGGTGASYTVQQGDVGKAITVIVTGTGGYTGTATSTATDKVKAANTAGGGQTISPGSAPAVGIGFTFNGDHARLAAADTVQVNGVTLNPGDYSITSGSTIVTLKKAYLDTLAPGTYTLKVNYQGSVFATSTFIIGAPSSPSGAPYIIAHPQDQTVTAGQTTAFSVTAGGAARYQWQINRGSGWEDISGAAGASYTTRAVTVANSGYQYRCVVSNADGSVTSNAAALKVTGSKSVPQTGDSSRPGLWMGLGISALAGLAAVGFAWRKLRKDA